MQIETERLRLREPEPSDWETLQRYHSLPEVRCQMLPGQETAAYVRMWVRASIKAAQHDPRRFYGLVVTLKTDCTLIGTCNLALSSDGTLRARIGWDMEPTHWGQGYATEAARALLNYGLEELGLLGVEARCFADNAPSRRVMEKLGLRQKRIGMIEDWGTRLTTGTLRPWVQYEIRSIDG